MTEDERLIEQATIELKESLLAMVANPFHLSVEAVVIKIDALIEAKLAWTINQMADEVERRVAQERESMALATEDAIMRATGP